MKKPSSFATAVKVFVGLLFIIMAFDMDDDTIAVSIVLGLAFLAWAVLPCRRFKLEMQEAQAGKLGTVKRPGLGVMIVKATFAALFIIMAFDMDDLSSVLISLLMGAVFIVWAVFPFLKYRQAIQTTEDPSAVSASSPLREPPHAVGHRTCPHCGAPMSGNVCEYCGMYSKNNDTPE